MTTQKNQTLVFNKFLRKYHDALTKLEVGQFISIKDTHKILSFLGYVQQTTTDQTLQLCHTISYMLSPQKDCKITRRNLFQFLRVISDIKRFPTQIFYQQAKPLQNQQQSFINQPLVCLRIGDFNQQNNQWTLTSNQQAQVKNIFGFMNLNRISRQHIKAEQKDNSQMFQQQTFQPQILHKSKQLAQKRSKRVSLSNSKVQERLLQSQSLNKSKLQQKVRKSVQKQMRQCPFKPKINRKSISIVNSSIYKFVDSMNNSFQNNNNKQNKQNVTQHGVNMTNIMMNTQHLSNNNNNNYDNEQKQLTNSKLQYNNSMQKSFCSINKSKVENKLLNKGREYQQRLSKLADEYRQMSEQMHMKQCTFQPRINHNSNINSINRNNNNYNNNYNNKSNNKNNKNINNQSNRQNKQNNPMNSRVSSSSNRNINSVNIRNAQKSIQRMKQARKIRQFQNQVKQRGYPKNIPWTKYICQNKSAMMIVNQSHNSNKRSPILCIDLKIMQTTRNLKVYEGQLLSEISQSICVDNHVPIQHWGKVQELLRNSISLCGQVRIFDNKVYLR